MTSARGTHTSPSDGSHENVSPGAAPVAPAGLLDDVAPLEEEIEFFADRGPPFEEALGDNEEDDGDKFCQDDTLWASSTFSLPEAGVDPTAMVDPSESDWVCLDRMG